MPILRSEDSKQKEIKRGVHRHFICLNDLMTTVIDFTNGPWAVPDPPHHHVHEQITYIAEDEIIFFCEGETAQKLKAEIYLVFLPISRTPFNCFLKVHD